MRRLPLLPTLIVALAVSAMIGLGIWQLRRAVWKEGLLVRYASALRAPLLHGLPDALTPAASETLAFRRAAVTCGLRDHPVQIGGRNARGATGYRTILPCATPRRAVLMVDLGWSRPGASIPALPFAACIRFAGRLIPDPQLARRLPGVTIPLLLVAETPAPTFQPSIPPSIADIPNNHRAYAVQWFLFAAAALVIYVMALRRRRG